MCEHYDFYTNEHEKKIMNKEIDRDEAKRVVMSTFWQDITGDEYREALNECGDDILTVKDAITKGEICNTEAAIKKIVFDYWFDDKVNDHIDNINNFKGE